MSALHLLLATEGVEGVSPDHIAADLAVPLGLLIFCGSIFALLWSNYGARKGALIFGVAMFGFNAFIGVFWWFGAPGTPVATGLQNFPGQAADAYQPHWYPFEAGSDRSEFFPSWEEFGLDDTGPFQTVAEFTGTTDIEDPMYASIAGDLDGVTSQMIAQFLPRNETTGGLDIGASYRTQLQEATPAAASGDRFVDWVASVSLDADGRPEAFLTIENGQRVAAARISVFATYESGDPVLVDEVVWFAFKDPGAIWLPSAVWTIGFFLLAGLCLALLDRIERREKAEGVEVEEPLDVQVPIAQ